MKNITPVLTFTNPVTVLEDGDAVAGSNTEVTVQALTNRTEVLQYGDRISGIVSAISTGDIDIPPASADTVIVQMSSLLPGNIGLLNSMSTLDADGYYLPAGKKRRLIFRNTSVYPSMCVRIKQGGTPLAADYVAFQTPRLLDVDAGFFDLYPPQAPLVLDFVLEQGLASWLFVQRVQQAFGSMLPQVGNALFGQSNALELFTYANDLAIIQVGSTGDFKFAARHQGLSGQIWNSSANLSTIFPPVGGQINALGVNNGLNMAQATVFNWHMPSAGVIKMVQLA